MSVETFTWRATTKTVGEITFATLDVQMGEGYSASAVDGPPNQARRQSWPLQLIGTSAQLLPARDFLDRHCGAKRFLWRPPGDDKPSYFRAKGYNRTPLGGDAWSLDFTFIYAGST